MLPLLRFLLGFAGEDLNRLVLRQQQTANPGASGSAVASSETTNSNSRSDVGSAAATGVDSSTKSSTETRNVALLRGAELDRLIGELSDPEVCFLLLDLTRLTPDHLIE